MTIKFYINQSDDKAVPKVLVDDITLTGTCKNPMDLINPKLTVTSSVSLEANYMYIEEFGRYYFCTIEVDKTGLYNITGHVDVLESFWEQIKNVPVVVSRSRNLYNAFIKDDKRPFYQYTRAQYKYVTVLPVGGTDLGKPNTPVLITVG